MKRPLHRRLALALIPLLLLAFLSPLAALPGQAQAEPLVCVYFPNWNVYSSNYGQVKDLPWDTLDCIYHAFWKVAPEGDGFAAVSTDPWADTDQWNAKAHFPQYEKYVAEHPNTKLLLSIGGWSCCGYFSEMALTEESRASFIKSCMEFLTQYPFFSGLDIDWEYPGVARSPSGDEGNPVKGDDKTNYTLLLKEMRAALDERFGKGEKVLTVCAAGSVSTLKKQDYAALFPYVDRINLMTYDMAGSWTAQASHHSPLYGSSSADTAVKYLMSQGVPAAKIAIGSPLYSHGWKVTRLQGDPLGKPAAGLSGDDSLLWSQLVKWEQSAVPEGTPGWHAGYDEKSEAAYLWNDDPDSPQYSYFYTYESSRSLDAKLRYITAYSLGGLIVWESGGDDAQAGYPMLTQMHGGLHP